MRYILTSLNVWSVLVVCMAYLPAQAQRARCATGSVMEKLFRENPAQKTLFLEKQSAFQQTYEAARRQRQGGLVQSRLQSIATIPVVVHIVMDDPSRVTDEQVQSQLDALNADYAGENPDAGNVPAAFAAVFGKSQIRFCLAQRTPDGQSTNGIIRKTSSTRSTTDVNDPVKRSVSGGSDAWDISRYLNIWVCRMDDNNDLGYTFMPGVSGISDSDVGLVTAYHAFGTMGTAEAPFNKGRTATHEIGHYFNLWHIWGANDCIGSCADSDFVDDTPNQFECTYGEPVFPQTDACTGTGSGIMFMNFMDYVNDGAMHMFTQGQVDRMELALATLNERKTLLTSDGCVPPVYFDNDVQVNSVNTRNSIVYCGEGIRPTVSITNVGWQTLTSVQLHVSVNGSAPVTTQVNVSLPSLQTTTITSSVVNVEPGEHRLTVYTTQPNGTADQRRNNDTLHTSFSVLSNVSAPLEQGFESNLSGWGITNNSDLISYNPGLTTSAARNGNASFRFGSYGYQLYGKSATLVSPRVAVPGDADSVKVTFWRAAAQLNARNSDTLEILYSVDCGQSFIAAYKKSGADLNPHAVISNSAYIPLDSQWVADTADLTLPVAGKHTELIVAFRSTNGYGNNVYLDDVKIYSVQVPTPLKEKGLTISPNPTTDRINIRHYPQATGLQGVAVYSSTGQLVFKEQYNGGQAPNLIAVNLGNQATGIYIVRLVYNDRVVTRKILKMQ